MGIVCPFGRGEDVGCARPPLRLVGQPGGDAHDLRWEGLDPSSPLRARWDALPAAVRAAIEGRAPSARRLADDGHPHADDGTGGDSACAMRVVVDDARLPRELADDLREGAPRLRSAFPGLTRRLEAIEIGCGSAVVDVACEGRHEGDLYGILAATGRVARFRERYASRGTHELRVSIDLRAVVVQLCAASRVAVLRPR